MSSIRMTKEQFSTLRDYLLKKKEESAVFLVAGYFQNNSGHHLVVKNLIIPRDNEYDDRTEFHIQMSPRYFNRVISIAEANNLTVIQCHSHPFDEDFPRYSPTDNSGESTSSKTIEECLNDKPMGSLLFGKKQTNGRIWIKNKSIPVDEIRLVDRHFQIITLNEQSSNEIDLQIYDRQIQAFGLKGQNLLSKLSVGIIGVGGTGSSIAEQLVREGVRQFIVVDHDNLEKSNITRVYGSTLNDIGKNKVDIVEENIKKINPDAKVQKIAEDVISQKTLSSLKNCDIIFSCTDRHAPRSVLIELSYQFFIPVIDVGVGLDSKDGKILGGTIRATLLAPTLPCLFCTGILNSETILAESLSKEDYESRKEEGYVTRLANDVPSVIIFTNMASNFGLLLMKDILFSIFDFDATTIIFDLKEFKTSRLEGTIRKECTCQMRFAKGDFIPLSAP